MKLYIQTESNGPKIDFSNKELKDKKLNDNIIDKLELLFPQHELYFITNDNIKNSISESSESCITLIRNADNYANIKLNNIMYFVEDENRLFEDFISLYPNVLGYIDFKFKNLYDYNIDVLKEQLQLISDLIVELYNVNTTVYLKQLTGFLIKEKFDDFGENAIFIDPELNAWYHPLFYYEQNEEGLLGNLLSFNLDNELLNFSQPHLICRNCESFYCRRNIYYNKIETNEFKVPAEGECALTSLLTDYSNYIYNKINNTKLTINNNLDKVENFEPAIEYDNLLKKIINSNNIKKINYNYSKTNSNEYRINELENAIILLNKIIKGFIGGN